HCWSTFPGHSPACSSTPATCPSSYAAYSLRRPPYRSVDRTRREPSREHSRGRSPPRVRRETQFRQAARAAHASGMTLSRYSAALRESTQPSSSTLISRVLAASVALFIVTAMLLSETAFSRVPHVVVVFLFIVFILRSAEAPLRLR